MPEKMSFSARDELLTFEEIERLVRIFVGHGVSHLRVTGGEPLVRRDIVSLVQRLSNIPGVADLSMTTNGALLAPLAQPLADAGLTRINVSLDTFDFARFKDITRWGDLGPVLDGLAAAQKAGLSPIKINAVLIRGVNEHEASSLVRRCRTEGWLLRFIEYMPIGIDNYWSDARFVPMDEIRTLLEADGFAVTPQVGTAPIGGGPAAYWDLVEGQSNQSSTVGFIAALTHNFCERCNRVRLTAEGRVRECLSAGGQLNLRDAIRNGATDQELSDAINKALYGKVEGHEFAEGSGGIRAYVPMSALGG